MYQTDKSCSCIKLLKNDVMNTSKIHVISTEHVTIDSRNIILPAQTKQRIIFLGQLHALKLKLAE